jgi:phosphatidylserine/phosphatidylglycerophosphate/cardiolipin synthase-like enzyme
LELLAGASHYDKVIGAIRDAHTSVWIATANVKGMLVEGGAQPGRRRSRTSGTYVSMVSQLDALAAKGVELRMLHGEIPSRPFREEIAKHPRLLADGGLSLARCPRVHLKAVVVDGALLYLGSANWTGAGLGAKGSGKRNFELGIITDDAAMLDDVQMMFERIWSGAECKGCKLRDLCPGPLDAKAPAAKLVAAKKRPRKPRRSR